MHSSMMHIQKWLVIQIAFVSDTNAFVFSVYPCFWIVPTLRVLANDNNYIGTWERGNSHIDQFYFSFKNIHVYILYFIKKILLHIH